MCTVRDIPENYTSIQDGSDREHVIEYLGLEDYEVCHYLWVLIENGDYTSVYSSSSLGLDSTLWHEHGKIIFDVEGFTFDENKGESLWDVLAFIRADDGYIWDENVTHNTKNGTVQYSLADFVVLCWIINEYLSEYGVEPNPIVCEIADMFKPSRLYPDLEGVLLSEEFYICPETVTALLHKATA